MSRLLLHSFGVLVFFLLLTNVLCSRGDELEVRASAAPAPVSFNPDENWYTDLSLLTSTGCADIEVIGMASMGLGTRSPLASGAHHNMSESSHLLPTSRYGRCNPSAATSLRILTVKTTAVGFSISINLQPGKTTDCGICGLREIWAIMVTLITVTILWA